MKEVLDNRYDIFACSDTAQFIDTMREEFPDRVIARDIVRSKDACSLHRHAPYAGHRQRRDALIDLLVLANAEIIYTMGSSFVNVVRFFNPSIKIIALSEEGSGISKDIHNFLPCPKKDLVEKAREATAWKENISASIRVVPKHIEHEKK